MSRPRNFKKNSIYHVYNRGNRKQSIFIDAKDYRRFLSSLHRYIILYDIYLIGYCSMPNHFHFIIRLGKNKKELPIFMQRLAVSYTMYFNKRYSLTGRMFQGPYKAKRVKSYKGLERLKRYINNNPSVADLVAEDEKYRWLEVF